MASRLDAGPRWAKQMALVRDRLKFVGNKAHLVGIGGIGMAGIARHLQARGIQVSGSELVSSRTTEWLEGHGIDVRIGHDASYIADDVGWVVKTPAVPESNPEVAEARRRGLGVVTRGAVLPVLIEGHESIAVSGTHGKTTTSAMIAHLLKVSGRDPSHCIGGEVDALGGVASVGTGDGFVVEADESDGTLVNYNPTVGVLTNVEFDHMEHFADADAFFDCFRRFAGQAQRVIYCADDAMASEICREKSGSVSYGESLTADVRCSDLAASGSGMRFVIHAGGEPPLDVELSVPGAYNVLNATAAAAVALGVGLSGKEIADGLGSFRNARRRFEVVKDTDQVLVVSDYAHHPTEIRAVLQAALGLRRKRVIAVYQPHRYTRTKALLEDFAPAFDGLDDLVMAPVYAASESPLDGGTTAELSETIRQRGMVPVTEVESLEAAKEALRERFQPGDLVMVLGAGDVEALAGWIASECE